MNLQATLCFLLSISLSISLTLSFSSPPSSTAVQAPPAPGPHQSLADFSVPVRDLRPRWASYRYTQTTGDLAAAESAAAAAAARAVPWWRRPGSYGLGVALFVIVALGHGIYLGATAVAEDEAAEKRLREEQLGQLRTLAGAAPAGRITVAKPKGRKRKGKRAM